MTSENTAFPDLQWHVTQDLIDAYGAVSGDKNPLHVDLEFAAKTSYGGTISHGFHTLAWLSQWAAAHFGEAWLSGGQLEVSFIGAVLPGDTATVRAEELAEPDRRAVQVTCVAQRGDSVHEVVVGKVSVPV